MLLTHGAIRKSRMVFVLMALLLIGGSVSYLALPREFQPEVVVPYFNIIADYEGASPKNIETLLAVPLEKEIADVDGVKNIYTSCSLGVVVITVEFDVSVDMNRAFQDLKDAVDKSERELPADMENSPTVIELDFTDEDIMTLSINGQAPRGALQAVSDDLVNYIEKVSGVREVILTGKLEYELELTVDPAKLALYNISLPSIVTTFIGENENRPGGSIEIAEAGYNITVPGQFDSLTDVSNLILAVRNDNPVYLKDIAEVRMRESEQKTLARVNGYDTINLGIKGRSGSDIVATNQVIGAIVAEARQRIPPTIAIDIIWDNSQWVTMMLDDLESSVATGFFFLAVIILFFLGLRSSLFVGVAIPFSLLISFLTISAVGFTLNMMVMIGIIVGIGMLVDNAIVIVENSYRHMEQGQGAKEAVETAINEVGWPIITSTLTTVFAFLPLAFWPGINGKFFFQFPITLVIVLSSSLLVALIINPVTCVQFMKLKKNKTGDDQWPPAKLYRRLLPTVLKHRRITVLMMIIYFFGSLVLFALFGAGSVFFPDSDQPPWIEIDIETPPGSNIDHTDGYTRMVEAVAMEYSDAESVVANVTSATSARVRMVLKQYDLVETPPPEIMQQLRDRFAAVAGAEITINSLSMGPPVSEGITLDIYGNDDRLLKEAAQLTEQYLAEIDGTAEVSSNIAYTEPELLLTIDRDKALIMDIPTNVIATTIKSYTDGFKIGSYALDDENDIDVVARLPEERIESINDLRTLMIPSLKGGQIPLSSVTNIEFAASSGNINRVNQQRQVQVSASVVGRNSNKILDEFFAATKNIEFPGGYRPQIGLAFDFENETTTFFMQAFIITVFLIFIVLVGQFESIIQAIIVLTSVALSSAGVCLFLFISRSPFTIIMTGLSIISLAGVAVNNAIVLIDYINQLRREGAPLKEAVIKAGAVRLRPVLLTALTTMAGMVPMAFGVSVNVRKLALAIDTPSGEWWKPMGQAMISGLFFATFLTLLAVPTLYYIFEGMKEKKKEKRRLKALQQNG